MSTQVTKTNRITDKQSLTHESANRHMMDSKLNVIFIKILIS